MADDDSSVELHSDISCTHHVALRLGKRGLNMPMIQSDVVGLWCDRDNVLYMYTKKRYEFSLDDTSREAKRARRELKNVIRKYAAAKGGEIRCKFTFIRIPYTSV